MSCSRRTMLKYQVSNVCACARDKLQFASFIMMYTFYKAQEPLDKESYRVRGTIWGCMENITVDPLTSITAIRYFWPLLEDSRRNPSTY